MEKISWVTYLKKTNKIIMGFIIIQLLLFFFPWDTITHILLAIIIGLVALLLMLYVFIRCLIEIVKS